MYKEDFKFEDGILQVHLSGKFPNEMLHEEQNLFQPLIDACSNFKCEKALIDARDLEVEFSIMALFQAGEDAVSLTRLGLRVAFWAREDMINTFLNNVVANRGGEVGIFTDMDAALEWLERKHQ